MRKFVINVNGTSYDVEVEEVKDGVVAAPAPKAAPAPAPKAAAPAAPKAAPAPAAKSAAVPDGATTVNAPMPGTILSVKVAPGEAVKKGTVLLILEAMKMENEIMAAADGTVASIAVSAGETVSTGQLLVAIQ